MRMRWIGIVAAAAAAAWIAAPGAHAGDGATTARPTAQSGFEALRKAVAEKDEPTLLKCLPADLVKDWPEQAKDEAKAWRAALAARVADGAVVAVNEWGGNAIARWKTGTPAVLWELRMRLDRGRWIASAPWAYCVGGGDVAKANGRSPGHVRIKLRRTNGPYGTSAFSFGHVTQDAKLCKNRMDLWYCAAGDLHTCAGGMITALGSKELAEIDGLQRGGDWMDQIKPRANNAFVVHVKRPGSMDFQVALRLTSVTADDVEFDWKVIAAGIGAPASVRKAQSYTSNDGDEAWDGNCGVR